MVSSSRKFQIVFVIATFCAAIMQSDAQGYEPNFSCANWDSYTAQDFVNMASGGSLIGENGRKCRLSQGGPGTACNWYVKYDIDGNNSNNWLGLSFQGVAGAGTGCCSSVSSCSTAVGAGAWLKSQHKNICCGPQVYEPNFSCANWDSYSAQDFVNMASGGSLIGENGRKCRLSQGGPGTACNWYVKYDIDGNNSNNWLGLSFQGVAGAGTGCCSSVSSCSTAVGAGAWLKSQHKNICCGPHVGYAPNFSCANWDSYSAQDFVNMASGGSIIGENGRRCRLSEGGPGTACNWYVKYDIDGSNNWLGLSFQGVAGAGTGCCSSVSSCSTAVGAGAWLKSQHKNICCNPTLVSGVITRPRQRLPAQISSKRGEPMQ